MQASHFESGKFEKGTQKAFIEQGSAKAGTTQGTLGGVPEFTPFLAKSMSEAVRKLGIGRTSFYRYIEQGKITAERVYIGENQIYNVYKSPSQPKAAFSEKGALVTGGVAMVTQPNLTSQETSQSVSHAQFLEEWIAWKDEGVGTKSWSTSHKKKCLRYVGLFFKSFRQVSAENLEKYLVETPILQWSLRRAKHAAVSSYAKFLYRKKKVLNRTEYYEIRGLYPKKPKDYKRDIKIIHSEHIPAILNSIQELYSYDSYKVALLTNLVIFLSETALRISEAAAITLGNLSFNDDPEQAYIHLPEYITKNGRERYVPFSPEAQQAVRAFLRVRPNDVAFDQVFLFNHRAWGYTTIKATSVGHIFEDVSEHCKVPFTAHAFRHYRITKWANDPNISITDVQYWAGHETLAVTQGYVHVRGKHSVKAAFAKHSKDNGANQMGSLLTLLDKLSDLSPEERKALLGMAVS